MKTKLTAGEKLLLSTHKSIRSIALNFLLLLILGYMLFKVNVKLDYIIAGIVILTVYEILNIINYRVYVTSKRLITETGLFSQNLQETMIDKINHINSKKNFLGALLNYGTVLIETSANESVTLEDMSDVNGIKELLNSARVEMM